MSTVPADTVTDVATSATVLVTFSEAMNQVVTEGAFSISPALTGTFSWNGPGDVLTFAPDVLLAEGTTTYTVTIGTGATDLAGNALAAAHIFTFTTLQPTPPADSGDDGCGCAPPGVEKMSTLQHSVGAALGYLLLALFAALIRVRTRIRPRM